ncbi:DUF5305 domain-containing protein [Halorubellus salinus]|uniref:DUF5305 domain-containing protein n=1 Tax=Halorubellus salinus TaxID=755309 RepID=UPI001D060332|nr:DUF5305 domain-containing protein [Halorubellus salinus]
MTDQALRLRALLDEQFLVLVLLLALVTVTGGWLVYTTHVDPGEERFERQAPSWSVQSEFDHRAVVTQQNPLYSVGSNLSNRSVYFATVSPRFEGAYRFSYRARESGELNSRVTLAVVKRGLVTEPNSENTTVVWQRTRTIGSIDGTTLRPDDSIRVPFSTNATALGNEVTTIEERLGKPSDRTQLYLRATVIVSGLVNGREVDRKTTHRLSLRFDEGTYRVSNAGPNVESFERTEMVTRERSFEPLREFISPILFFIGCGGLGVLVVVQRRGSLPLTEQEHARLEYLDDRNQFDEWISEIRLPEEALELPEAEASSLGSLVDFAIDTENGVIEAPGEEVFYVVHDGYLYTYRPPVLDEAREPAAGAEEPTGDADDGLDSFDFSFLDRDERSEDDLPSSAASHGDEN